MTITSTGAGSVTPFVGFSAGDSQQDVTFSAAGIGPATITVQNPPGYTAPTDGSKTVQATVADGGCLAGNITVGRNLETTMRVGLNGIAPPGGVSMTVTSNDPSKLRFSKTSAGAGAAAITLSLPENAGASPEFLCRWTRE